VADRPLPRDEDGVRASRDVEVKWGIHPAGEGREDWVTDEQRTTLLLLVSGRFRIDLSVGSFILERRVTTRCGGQGSTTTGRLRRTRP
jgi:hypothetical protein